MAIGFADGGTILSPALQMPAPPVTITYTTNPFGLAWPFDPLAPANHNIAALNEVMDHIDAHPDDHDQSFWASPVYDQHPDGTVSCRTTACFAGWAVLLHPDAKHESASDPIEFRGNYLGTDAIPALAQQILGLDWVEAAWMFNGNRTVDELRLAVRLWTAQAVNEGWTADDDQALRELLADAPRRELLTMTPQRARELAGV
jgi:hypothetical protein